MDNLPFLVLKKIFNGMDNLNQVIKLSLVCKSWRAAYEACKPETLCPYFGDFLWLNYQLSLSNEKLQKINFFKISDAKKFLESDITKFHFANIRKLVIFEDSIKWRFLPDTIIYQSDINELSNLEYLEISLKFLFFEGDEINLPKLKTACFHVYDDFEEEKIDDLKTQITLNTPSLEALFLLGHLPNFSKFKILFPHKLKWLQFTNKSEKHNLKLDAKFDNLECLI